MSFMKTLAKVAVGVAIAKGASALMKPSEGQAQPASSGGLGGLLAGAGGGSGLQSMLSGVTGGSTSAGGVQDMLGGLLSGAQGGAGGLGSLLENLGGTNGQGGLQDMLGGLAGAAGAGGLLGSLSGALGQAAPAENTASFGQVLNSAFDENPEPAIVPSADQEAAAALMLRAMIQAAKCDGNLDAAEEEKLIGKLGGDVDAQEAQFVQEEMQAPVDVDGLVAQVPSGMEQQIYAVSLLAIDLDSQAEAKYLHKLAQGMGLDAETVNNVHAQFGVPSLYT